MNLHTKTNTLVTQRKLNKNERKSVVKWKAQSRSLASVWSPASQLKEARHHSYNMLFMHLALVLVMLACQVWVTNAYISSISPRYGSSQGGTILTIRGGGLISNDTATWVLELRYHTNCNLTTEMMIIIVNLCLEKLVCFNLLLSGLTCMSASCHAKPNGTEATRQVVMSKQAGLLLCQIMLCGGYDNSLDYFILNKKANVGFVQCVGCVVTFRRSYIVKPKHWKRTTAKVPSA